jgi:hypothetical protein
MVGEEHVTIRHGRACINHGSAGACWCGAVRLKSSEVWMHLCPGEASGVSVSGVYLDVSASDQSMMPRKGLNGQRSCREVGTCDELGLLCQPVRSSMRPRWWTVRALPSIAA